jgi:integrase
MRGNITRRGKSSWRLKFDLDAVDGKRRTHTVTVRGTRKDAEAKLAELLNDSHRGTLADPSKLTVSEFLRAWIDGRKDLTRGSHERYRDVVERQVIPVIGSIELQKLKPIHIRNWLAGLGVSARTATTVYRVLYAALKNAVELELVTRNVAAVVKPPKADAPEVEILGAEDIARVLAALKDDPFYPVVALALATGMRRGELLALRWSDVDLAAATVKVERALEETTTGLHFKGPKSKHGKRTISLPPSTVEMLQAYRKAQLEQRLRLGLGKPGADALVFGKETGGPFAPKYLSVRWRRATKGIVDVTFHALRHSHASALIAAGVDVVTVSRRLGHSSPTITLNVYAHLFTKTDTSAATAIEATLRGGK